MLFATNLGCSKIIALSKPFKFASEVIVVAIEVLKDSAKAVSNSEEEIITIKVEGFTIEQGYRNFKIRVD